MKVRPVFAFVAVCCAVSFIAFRLMQNESSARASAAPPPLEPASSRVTPSAVDPPAATPVVSGNRPAPVEAPAQAKAVGAAQPAPRPPSPADPVVREAVGRFERETLPRIENCAGGSAARSNVPVQVVFRRISPPEQERQAFIAVSVHAQPFPQPEGLVTATPQSERCLGSVFAGTPLFLPRSSTTAAEFTQTLSLMLPTVAAHF